VRGSVAGVELEAWVARLRAGEEIEARRREVWARQQLSEDATLAGVMVDLAERGPHVVVDSCRGSRTLRIVAVGRDFCAGVDRSRWVLVALGAVESIRSTSASLQPGGHRAHTLDVTLAEALSDLLADRPRLTMATTSGRLVSGELRAVGADVVTVRTESDPPGVAHVVLDRIVEVLVATP